MATDATDAALFDGLVSLFQAYAFTVHRLREQVQQRLADNGIHAGSFPQLTAEQETEGLKNLQERMRLALETWVDERIERALQKHGLNKE